MDKKAFTGTVHESGTVDRVTLPFTFQDLEEAIIEERRKQRNANDSPINRHEIRLKDSTWEGLQDEARACGVSVSEIVQKIASAWIEASKARRASNER